MHFRTGSRPELAGLDRDAQQAVRRLAWHFAQRHWGLHLPAVVWLAVALAHSHFGVLPGGRDYLVALYGADRRPELVMEDVTAACAAEPHEPFPELEGGYVRAKSQSKKSKADTPTPDRK